MKPYHIDSFEHTTSCFYPFMDKYPISIERIRWAWETAANPDATDREEAIIILESVIGHLYGWHKKDNKYIKRPVTPLLAVDIIIEIQNWYPLQIGIESNPQREHGIVIIERKHPPYGYALPGGMVDVGETTIDAAIREAKEETGLDITNLKLLGIYDNPKRDPRDHVVSIVYVAQAIGKPVAADDAKNALIINPLKDSIKLCYDHTKIITDYILKHK